MQPAVDPLAQASPAPVTVPEPVPLVVAVSGMVLVSNFAVTVLAPFIVAVHTFGRTGSAVQPIQLLNTESGLGVAVSSTVV